MKVPSFVKQLPIAYFHIFMQPGTKTPCVSKRVGRRLDPSWQAEKAMQTLGNFAFLGITNSNPILIQIPSDSLTQPAKHVPFTRPSLPVGVKWLALAVNLSSHPRLKEDSPRLQDYITVGWECESFTSKRTCNVCVLQTVGQNFQLQLFAETSAAPNGLCSCSASSSSSSSCSSASLVSRIKTSK